MSQDRPSLAEILRTVAEFLDGLRPKLEGEAQYGALVSAYILRIAEREVALSMTLDADEQNELAALLGRSGSLIELNQILCESIRAGRFDDDWTRLRRRARPGGAEAADRSPGALGCRARRDRGVGLRA